MKIGIIGAGNVGSTLGRALVRAGHRVLYGVRAPEDEKYRALRGPHAEVGSLPEAVASTDAILLATPWDATEAALEAAGDFRGKALLDATNPIGPGLSLTHGHTDSGAEQVARWARNARVVKVLNTTGVEVMADPRFGASRAAMFLCGDDEGACTLAATLARDLGFDPLRVGGLTKARVLEPAALLWIHLAVVLGHGRHVALGLVRREAHA